MGFFSKKLIESNEYNKLLSENNANAEIIKQAITIIENIRLGNFSKDSIKQISPIFESLINLNSYLENLNSEEKARLWISEGLNNLTQLLYDSSNDFKTICNTSLKRIVNYLNSVQGGIFIINEQNNNLEQIAGFAYNRNKYLTNEIQLGEGVLGQVFLEKQKVLITHLPKNYFSITSGIGEAEPSCVLICPLLNRDKCYGVIELASFTKFTPKEIEYVENFCNELAIVTVNELNKRTNDLIFEESKKRADELSIKESLLLDKIQEMEELSNEMQRKEAQISKLFNESHEHELQLQENVTQLENARLINLNHANELASTMAKQRDMLIAILDQIPQKVFLKDENGCFLVINSAVARAHNLPIEELLGTSDFDHFSYEASTAARKTELEIINSNTPAQYIHQEDLAGKTVILKTIKMPFLLNVTGKIGLLGVQTDITDQLALEKELEEKNNRIQELEKELNELKRKTN